jgi:glycosyltransferase involved in cell wall biosynthesis
VTIRLAVATAGSTGFETELIPALERSPELEVVRLSPAPAKDLAQEMREWQAEVLLATGSNRRGLAAASSAARRAKAPSLLRCDWRDGLPVSFVERWRRRGVVRRFDMALAIGAGNRRYLEGCGVGTEKLADAPNGIRVAELAQSAAAVRPRRRELRDGLGVASDWFCIVFADPLETPFRPFDVLDALAVSRRDQSALRLLVVGSGSLEGDLRARASERRLPVTFLAVHERSDLLAVFAAADVVVCPGDGRVSWSTPVAEAMASGLAAVVSKDVGFGEDLVEEGVSGFTHDQGDASALAACLATLAADPIRAAVMGDAARIRAGSLSLDRTVSNVVSAASSLIRG